MAVHDSFFRKVRKFRVQLKKKINREDQKREEKRRERKKEKSPSQRTYMNSIKFPGLKRRKVEGANQKIRK